MLLPQRNTNLSLGPITTPLAVAPSTLAQAMSNTKPTAPNPIVPILETVALLWPVLRSTKPMCFFLFKVFSESQSWPRSAGVVRKRTVALWLVAG